MLGINGGVVLVGNGRFMEAANEERYSRQKGHQGFSDMSRAGIEAGGLGKKRRTRLRPFLYRMSIKVEEKILTNKISLFMDNMQHGGGCHHCGFCGCFHHKIVPGAIFLITVTFFLQAIGVVSMAYVALAWPVLLGLAMLVKLTAGNCKCYSGK